MMRQGLTSGPVAVRVMRVFRLFVPIAVFIVGAWLIGALLYTAPLQRKLKDVAERALATAPFASELYDVQVSASGQQLTVSGRVASAEVKQQVEHLLARQLRFPGWLAAHNPVTKVYNQLVLSATQSPQAPYLVLARQGDSLAVYGIVPSHQEKEEFFAALRALTHSDAQGQNACTVGDYLSVSSDRKPFAKWQQTVAEIPKLSGPAFAASNLALSTGDGTWHFFGKDARPSDILDMLDGTGVDEDDLNQWLPTPLSSQAAAAQPGTQAPVPAQPTPHVLLLHDGTRLEAIGTVRSEAERDATRAKLEAVFSDIAGVDLKLAPALTAGEGRTEEALASGFDFALPTRQAPYIGLFAHGQEGRYFGPDVFDSELAAAFPALALRPAELALKLEPFRLRLLQQGKLIASEPYVQVLASDSELVVSGLVSSEASRQQILRALRERYPEWQIVDQLRVSALVAPLPRDFDAAAGLPSLLPGQVQSVLSRSGQSWRVGPVHSIYFPTGADRSEDQDHAVKQMLRLLERLPQAHFEIVGHTDDVGSREANIALSEARASQFLSYAVAAGLEARRLKARGAGPDEPLAPNDKESNRALNRRVDVLLLTR